ncbi:shikimate kinase AroL [Desulfovibrio mangrovi]|uniref:shikimate kinase AroL n=1 Tax=Desulfovibrio mangrovi TaxID=2976983 RepID=UPI0022481068|nr:shikimate kinase AroL [Desulfovibrio mangrovi]UZP68855.1 shikimate kinase AroL [Desulfovibrio mangrovi]
MQTRRIYLVGPRACGKTTVGKALAEALGWRFTDTDEVVVRGAGCAIADIVERRGWDAFRDMETAALRALSGEDAIVIATGGGMVLRAQNRDLMRESGLVVLLTASADVLAERLSVDPLHAQRPSLTGKSVADEVAEVLRERAPMYAAAAHMLEDATQPVGEIVASVMQVLEKGEIP